MSSYLCKDNLPGFNCSSEITIINTPYIYMIIYYFYMQFY